MAQADTIIPPGVQGLDRYAYVNNSPLNFVDLTGHFTCSSDLNNDDYCPGHSSLGTSGDGDANLDDYNPPSGEGDNGCGQGGSVDCPPPPKEPNACYINQPCTIDTKTTVHPDDYLFPPTIGKNYIYGPDGQILGYRELIMMPPKNIFKFRININANTGLHAWGMTGTQMIAAGLDLIGCAGVCSKAVGTINTLDLINQTITYEGRLIIGPIVPLNNRPLGELPLPQFFNP